MFHTILYEIKAVDEHYVFCAIRNWKMRLALAILRSSIRLTTHSQNMTVAARQTAEKKTIGHLS